MRLLKFFLKKSSSGWFEKVLSWIGLGLNLGFRIWWISGRSKIGDTVSWTLTVWYRTTVYGNGRTAVLAPALQGSRVYVGRLCWWVHVIKDVWRKFTHNPAQRGVVLKLFIDFVLKSSITDLTVCVCLVLLAMGQFSSTQLIFLICILQMTIEDYTTDANYVWDANTLWAWAKPISTCITNWSRLDSFDISPLDLLLEWWY